MPKQRDRLGRRSARLAALSLAACGADYLSGRVLRLLHPDAGPRATVIGRSRERVRCATVLLPGFLMSGSLLGLAFAPYLGEADVLIGVDYGRDSLVPDAIYQELRPLLDAMQPEKLQFYGASMGGLVAVRIIHCYGNDGMPFGKAALVLDTAPSSCQEIRRPTWLFKFGSLYRGGMISSAILAGINAMERHPQPDSSADLGLLRTVRRGDLAAGALAATTQARFIQNSNISCYSNLQRYLESVVFLSGFGGDLDPLVNVTRSISRWRSIFPDMKLVTISGRSGRWHLPLFEQPRATAETLLSWRVGAADLTQGLSEVRECACGLDMI